MGAEKMPEGERGEGNYTASKKYDEASEKFVKDHGGEIEEMARDAVEDLDGKDGDELRRAEAEGKSHARK